MANPASMRLVARYALEQELENPPSRVELLAEQRRLIGLGQQRGTITSAFPPWTQTPARTTKGFAG
jgi:hypothetical protein